jgi:NAD(P)-dependent dehydrogenase (short-subunit alcohol dehydrogenase family)
MHDMSGKTCVITGAGRGLGRAMALKFARSGANVIGGSRNLSDLKSLEAEIQSFGGKAATIGCDINSSDDIARLAEVAGQEFGSLDVWINNAGGLTPQPDSMAEWIDVGNETVKAMFSFNVIAQIAGAQKAARAMRDYGKGGVILFLNSISGLYTTPGGEGMYGACKATLTHITATMAAELGQYGIRVNGIAPGLIETELTKPFLSTEEDRRNRSRFYPLGRVGQPDDVANAALFLSSDDAKWISGATLLVTGGATFASDPYRYLIQSRA